MKITQMTILIIFTLFLTYLIYCLYNSASDWKFFIAYIGGGLSTIFLIPLAWNFNIFEKRK